MNKQEIYEKIKKLILDTDQQHNMLYEYIDEHLLFENMSQSDKDLFENCSVVEHYGGEGKGEYYNTTWYFPNPDIYIDFYGWYYSYDGANFDNMTHVEPKEVKVIKYVTYDNTK